jgi:ACR3 family arsenite efflux pump ArsB
MKNRLEWQVGISVLMGLATGTFLPDLSVMPLVPVALFLMLWPAMLDMELSGLRGMYQRPRVLLLSLFLNFMLSPLLLYALSSLILTNVSPVIMVGMLLFGLMPCGGMAPAYTGMLQGNVGLSVSIAATSLLLSIGVVPLWTEILIGRLVAVPIALAAQSMAVTVFLPLLFAWLIRRVVVMTKGEDCFRRVKPTLQGLSVYGLMLLGFAVFGMNGRKVVQDPMLMLRIALVSFLFLTALLAGAMLLGKKAGLPHADLTALVISSATKNNAISLALALLLFDSRAVLAITVAGPMVQMPVMLGCQRWCRRNSL